MSEQSLPPLPQLAYAEIRHIGGWPGYAVTSNGEVWSCRANNSLVHSFRPSWKILKKAFARKYWTVLLSNKAFRKRAGIHRLMLEAFIGACPPGHQACHNNGNPLDNRLENLRWDTPSSNNRDKEKHGTHQTGERHNKAKLKNSDIRAIRSLLDAGELQKHIAVLFSVNPSTIGRVARKETWRHITELP